MMRKTLWCLILTILAAACPAGAARYLAGEFNGWDAAGNLMTDNGDGTYTATLTGLLAGGRYEFKITDSTWDWNYPSANSWFFADSSGRITITFNENIVEDGWQPAQNRIGLSTDPGTWTIAGSFQGWNNANPATAMTPIGGGIYLLEQTLDPGEYKWKAVVTGSWDSISTDTRSVGTADATLTVDPGEENVRFYVDALTGVVGVNVEVRRPDRAHDPDPENFATDVPVDGLVLSWTVADPNDEGVADPNLNACDVYIGIEGTDPNLYYQGTVTTWDPQTLRASFPFVGALKDTTYRWRVDSVMDDDIIIPGFVWEFSTEQTTPKITQDPEYQVVPAGGTAVFTVAVSSISPPTFQWYRYVDGVSDLLLTDGGDISGAQTDTLSIANVELADEGGYYCVVNNDSGIPDTSELGLLGVRRRIAYWPFEEGDADSTVPGSPISMLYNDPNFVSGGILGDGMQFDNDPGAEDILYTDPDQVSYFDICNASMTVACWVQSSFAATWGPLVARNGENGQGWQLRHSGETLDRVCFTTRTDPDTDYDDGTASNRTVYDGQWHYVVSTFDGMEKKVYIDGVISRVYSSDDGSIVRESDAVSGRINASLSPVSLAGRVRGDAVSGLIFEDVTPCILDEVEIYNYALDAETIARNYADITGTAVCPAPLAHDLNSDCVIDLDDAALLAAGWLTDTSVQPAP